MRKIISAALSLCISTGSLCLAGKPISNAVSADDNRSSAIFGDFTEDGIIDGRDATDVLTLYAKSSVGSVSVTADQLGKGDVNKDSILDGRDASIILSFYAKASLGYAKPLEEFVAEQTIGNAVTTTSMPSNSSSVTTTTDSSAGYVSNYDKMYCLWTDITDDQDFVFNDRIIKITFKIKEGIPDRDYSIRLNPDLSTISGTTVRPEKIVQGRICVGSESVKQEDLSSEEKFTVYGNNVACKQGDTVDYYISFKNNPGVAAVLLWFYYDRNAMEVVSAEAVGEFAELPLHETIEFGKKNKEAE